MKVFAIELNGCDGIYDVVYVAANDRNEAVNVLKASRKYLTWYDVIWLEGASYETDKPCEIKSRLCTEVTQEQMDRVTKQTLENTKRIEQVK